MVDDSLSRPKRALSDDTFLEPTVAAAVPDDTPVPPQGPRRGAASDAPDAPRRMVRRPARAAETPTPSRHVEEESGPEGPEVVEPTPDVPDDHAFFMRPGHRSRPDSRHGAEDAAGGPRPAAAAGAARALPPSVDGAPGPATTSAPTPRPLAPETPGPGGGGSRNLPGGHKLLIAWVTGVLVVALAVFFSVYLIARDTPTTTPTSPDGTATSTGSTPTITTNHLISEAEAETIKEGAGWKTAATIPTVTADSPRVACVVAAPDLPNPVFSAQRTLSTTTASKMALLHQIDNYASAEDAGQVFQARKADLGVCDDVPAWIAGATAVSGLGDETASVTIAYQDPVVSYHTVLLVRVGTVVNSFDLANNATAAEPLPLAQAAAEVTARQCAIAKGSCPEEVTAAPALPAPAGEIGWLVASDIPRITRGQGSWTETAAAQVTSLGTGCEDMTLKAVTGAKQALQRTYLLLQDSTAPQNFGVDTLVFTMASPRTATILMTKLTANIAACEGRMSTATVSQAKDLKGVGADDLTIAGKQFVVSQKVGSNTQTYRVAVTATGDKVSYLLVNASPGSNFSADEWSRLALRAAQRASQAD